MQDTWRKNLKIIFLLTLVVSLVGTTSALAWDGMGGGKGHGRKAKRWMLMNLTPEQAGQVFDLRQKFMNDTAELRKSMMVKRVELAQLWKAEKPNDQAILAKVKELSALKGQFMEKAVAQRLAMRKIAPEAMGSCPMFGPGKGPGPMMGPGKGLGPGTGKGKGRGQGAGLIPGSEDMAEYEADVDLELALIPHSGWHNGF
jgi:zinc resistance-associated protein